MNRMYIHLMNVLAEAREDRGATGVEYGIMVAAIAAVIVVAAFSIGGKVGGAFDTVDATIPGA